MRCSICDYLDNEMMGLTEVHSTANVVRFRKGREPVCDDCYNSYTGVALDDEDAIPIWGDEIEFIKSPLNYKEYCDSLAQAKENREADYHKKLNGLHNKLNNGKKT